MRPTPMKPPGRLKHIPSVMDEQVGAVTVAVGSSAVVVSVIGLGLLAMDWTAADGSALRPEGLQSTIPRYLIWEWIRLGAQACLGVVAAVAGLGLRDGWPWARRLAARYGVGALF